MAKVSVVMTLYNCEQYIGEAIESALAQTYTDREIIVIDDGSTDGSAFVVKKFGNAARYVYQPNGGVAKATNKGVALSSGSYIAFLENDDVWLPQKLERQVAILEERPEVDAVTCDLRYFSEQSQPLDEIISGYCPEDSYSRLFLGGFNFMLSALMLRRSVFNATGGFDEGFKAAGLQDVEWYARLMQIARVHWIAEPLTLFRRHGVRVASDVTMYNTQYMLDRLRERFGDDPKKRRYLLDRQVSFLSDLGKYKIERGLVQEGRQDIKRAIRLAVAERVGGKMVLRSVIRLARTFFKGKGLQGIVGRS
jgi:glycosyltransferase involved in cell wall biosynthesis